MASASSMSASSRKILVQNQQTTFDQTKATGNGELEPFGDIVLHLEGGSGGGVGSGRFLPAIVLSWFHRSVSWFMCPQAQVVHGRTTTPRRAGEAEEGHLLKVVVPEVTRLVEEGFVDK